ncbi:hypothetical protein Tco_1006714 [Tanacetum coccineum]|uniref:Uncharacterized protein n=1 Tax=Tanacetum coccineum TaxID=301880 RepID=A0ABQ5FIU0_9ASTR
MLQICSQKHLMLADFNIRLQVLECLTSEVLIEGRLIVLICSGLYTKDGWNGMQKLLRMELGLKLYYWAKVSTAGQKVSAPRLTFYC